MSRIIPMIELSAMDEAFHVQLLPDIYAEEIERLRTSERAIAE